MVNYINLENKNQQIELELSDRNQPSEEDVSKDKELGLDGS
jgi:hypothetical protein